MALSTRRQFAAALGSVAAWPLAARAQTMRRVGVLFSGTATDATQQSYLAAFVHALQQLGWNESQNLRIDARWSAGDAELARLYAAQLIGLMPDVILAQATVNLTALRDATTTIPVVFTQVSDPVAQGFVASIIRPGGNLTGFSQYEFTIGGKWLDLLKKAAPGLIRIAVMFNPDTSPQSRFLMRSVEAAAVTLGVEAIVAVVRTTTDIEPAMENLAHLGNGGLLLPTDTFIRPRMPLISELAIRHRLPAIAGMIGFAKEGGLMYYGAQDSLLDTYRQAAGYVDRILKGVKPNDLPIQAPTRYHLVINLKTAKTLGLTVPPTLLATADDVIE